MYVFIEPVSSRLVAETFCFRKNSLSPLGLEKFIETISSLSNSELMVKSFSANFQGSWDELYNSTLVWNKVRFNVDTVFENKIFKSLLGTKDSLGITTTQLLNNYHERLLTERDYITINKIRTTLFEKPYVIVLTEDDDSFVIYDGWHTILAFLLEKKPIVAYLGKGNLEKTYILKK